MKDYVVANLEIAAPYMAKKPTFFNFFMQAKLVQNVVEKTLGMTDLPLLSTPNLQDQLVDIGYRGRTLEGLESLSTAEKSDMLLIVQDPYTSYYDAKVVCDFVALTQKLGYRPVLLPFKPNGKAQHIKGFLGQFSRTAKTQAEFLNRMAKLELPLVGVDPAIVLSYRDEYKEILGDMRGNFHVITAHEWLTTQRKRPKKRPHFQHSAMVFIPSLYGSHRYAEQPEGMATNFCRFRSAVTGRKCSLLRNGGCVRP